jgi:dephospho-CoA kinase
MFILGLTGSLGMGKSTTARFFAEEGVPVHDADAVVHRLYDGQAAARARGEKVAVLDIPLLFETGGEKRVDAVVVVSAPPEVQRSRVLQRPGMSVEKLDAILAKQMPDEEKRRRADFVVDTSRGLEPARAQVRAILDAVATMPKRR